MTFKPAALAAIAILNLLPACVIAQGRGIPNATPEQTEALTQMSADLALPTQRLIGRAHGPDRYSPRATSERCRDSSPSGCCPLCRTRIGKRAGGRLGEIAGFSR